MTDGLTTTEAAALAREEITIRDGIESFKAVGLALARVRDGRLYRATHETFDAYCRERWDMDRTYAHRVIESAAIAAVLPIDNIWQGRALAAVPPDQRAEVLKTAAAAGPVTAKSIKQAADSRYLSPPLLEPDIEAEREKLAQKRVEAFGVNAQEITAIEVAQDDLAVIKDAIKDKSVDAASLLQVAKNLKRTANLLEMLARVVEGV